MPNRPADAWPSKADDNAMDLSFVRLSPEDYQRCRAEKRCFVCLETGCRAKNHAENKRGRAYPDASPVRIPTARKKIRRKRSKKEKAPLVEEKRVEEEVAAKKSPSVEQDAKPKKNI